MYLNVIISYSFTTERPPPTLHEEKNKGAAILN